MARKEGESARVCKKRRNSESGKHICDVSGSENLTKYRRTKKITGQIGPWFKGLHLKPLRYRGTIVNRREWTSELVIQLTKAVTINFSHRFVCSFVRSFLLPFFNGGFYSSRFCFGGVDHITMTTTPSDYHLIYIHLFCRNIWPNSLFLEIIMTMYHQKMISLFEVSQFEIVIILSFFLVFLLQGSADSNYSQPSSDLSLDEEKESLRREKERQALTQLEKARVSFVEWSRWVRHE